MKEGYLIYEDWEAKKNKAMIQMFQERGRREGLHFSFVGKEAYTNAPLPDFVLNRTRDAKVSAWYEKKNIPVFHTSIITEVGNHKKKTLDYLKSHLPKEMQKAIWAPQTYAIEKTMITDWIIALQKEDFSVFTSIPLFQKKKTEMILKSVDGHGGNEVTLLPIKPRKGENFVEAIKAAKQEERNAFMEVLKKFQTKECILQERILGKNQDVRVYILGNSIYQAVLREGKDDFRSNFSLGGSVKAYALSQEQEEYVMKFLKAFDGEILGMAGMDFLIDTQGRFLFNELEEMVGSRMLYQTTSLDIVKDYVVWLKRFV